MKQLLFFLVDGGWTEWTDFSQCTKSCGFGSQIRSRTCTNPEPKHDGKPCFGPREEAIECIIVDCPGWWRHIVIFIAYSLRLGEDDNTQRLDKSGTS